MEFDKKVIVDVDGFIENGKQFDNMRIKSEYTAAALLAMEGHAQVSLFDEPSMEDKIKCLTGEM